jgi:hypothetical protein
MEQPPVRRADFGGRLTPVANPQPLPPPKRHWSDEAWQVIRQGIMPRDMDDRWIAFVEDDRLYLHRSWTGYGVYEAGFVRNQDGWIIAELVVCGDRSRYRRSTDAYESAYVEFIISAVLLGDHDPDAWARLEALWE